MNAQRPHWKYEIKILVSLLILVLMIYLLFRFRVVIAPFIISVILAYILSPLVGFMQNRMRIHRVIATGISYLILIAILVTIPVLLTPLVGNQVQSISQSLQTFIEKAEDFLSNQQFTILGQAIDISTLFKQAVGSLQGMMQPVISQSLDLVVRVVSSVVWLIFILVVSFHLVKDAEKLKLWLEHLVPPDYRQDYIWLRGAIGEVWGAFFRGQIVLSLVVMAIFSVIGLILGLPFAIGMGILAGLLEFLPSLGHGIWLTIAALVALFVGSTWLPLPSWVFALIIVSLHLFFQQFDLNYLIPRIIGRSVHLPPLVVILGIVSGAVLGGILGIVLAAPTIASARVLGRYIYANLFDMEPFGSSILVPTRPPNLQWWRAKKEGKP